MRYNKRCFANKFFDLKHLQILLNIKKIHIKQEILIKRLFFITKLSQSSKMEDTIFFFINRSIDRLRLHSMTNNCVTDNSDNNDRSR